MPISNIDNNKLIKLAAKLHKRALKQRKDLKSGSDFTVRIFGVDFPKKDGGYSKLDKIQAIAKLLISISPNYDKRENITSTIFSSYIMQHIDNNSPYLSARDKKILLNGKTGRIINKYLSPKDIKNLFDHLELKPIEEKNLVTGEKIAVGNYGVVYKALYNKNDAAVKTVKTKSKKNAGKYKEELESLKDETVILAKIPHPNIISIYGFQTTVNSEWALVMEYAPTTLDAVTIGKKDREPTLKQLYKYSYQMAIAIAYVHKQKIIHLDLKPKNILISVNDDIKIADFGLAYDFSSKKPLIACGTLNYTAPEIFSTTESPHYDFKVDVYSLGIIVWQMTTATSEANLYPGISPQMLMQAVPTGTRPSSCDANKNKTTPALENMLKQMLFGDPKQRLSAQALVDEHAGLDKSAFKKNV